MLGSPFVHVGLNDIGHFIRISLGSNVQVQVAWRGGGEPWLLVALVSEKKKGWTTESSYPYHHQYVQSQQRNPHPCPRLIHLPYPV